MIDLDWAVLTGISAAIALGLQYVVRSFNRVNIDAAVDAGLAQHVAISKALNAAAPEEGATGYRMISKGQNSYGQVIETVSLRPPAPRYKPTCEWCRAQLVLDGAGKCGGCGATP